MPLYVTKQIFHVYRMHASLYPNKPEGYSSEPY